MVAIHEPVAAQGQANQPKLLHVDWSACAGRGLCIELFEGKLRADDWGYPQAVEGNNIPIESNLVSTALEAVAACPMRALRLI